MKKHVLIVDDEVDLLDFLNEFFSERDFAVQVAKTAEQALELYQTFEPDVVLCFFASFLTDEDKNAIQKKVKKSDLSLVREVFQLTEPFGGG